MLTSSSNSALSYNKTLHQTEQVIQELQERLAELQNFGAIGFWEWDIVRKKFTASTGFLQIYGSLTPVHQTGSISPVPGLLSPVLSEDLEYTADSFNALFEDEKPFSIDYHIPGIDGHKKYIHHQAHVEYNTDGTAEKIVGYIKDITEKERSLNLTDLSRKKYEILYEKYKDLFENANDAIFIVDQDLKYVDVNKKAVELFGFSKEEFLTMSILDVIPPNQKPLSSKEFNALWKDKKYDRFIGKQRTKDGRWLNIEVNSSAIIEKGKIVGSRDIVRDVSERMQMEERLRELSITDDLTGLLNRRGFLAMASKQLHIIQRTREELLILYADLDNLKGINDQLGHENGDLALRETARLFKQTFRETDIIARMGGDEFVILLTGKPGECNELRVKNRLGKKLTSFNKEGRMSFSLMFSIGVSRYNHDSPCSIEDLLSKADTLMFKQKRKKKEHLGHSVFHSLCNNV